MEYNFHGDRQDTPLQKKVSVIIATFNRADYVRQAVDSILAQTLRDFELIVVDDGSTDGTLAVLAEYGDRIRVIATTNQGAARARNAGLSVATGEYVAFLDSDDLADPERLALQAAVLDTFPDVGLVYTECAGFDDRGWSAEYHLKAYHASAYARSGATYENLFDGSVPVTRIKPAGGATRWGPGWRNRRIYAGSAFDRYLVDVFVLAVSSMIRRSLVIAAGLQNPRFGFFHDREFILRLCRMSRVAFIDLPLYRIRYHADQISTTVGRRAGYILIRKQQDLLRVLRVHGVRDQGYYRARHAIIDRQLVKLCRAVAIALLSFHLGSAHQLRCFPHRAGAYLAEAKKRGKDFRLLRLAARLPLLPRRLLMKYESVYRRLTTRAPA